MRLITRSDFDGLVCATLLEAIGLVDEIFYTHPKDLQDGKVPVTANDVLANVPYVAGCGLWFDHHASEAERMAGVPIKGAIRPAPSAARVIFDFYRQSHPDALASLEELVEVTDIVDSAQFAEADILDPRGWMMLAFIADPRSGLGRKRKFRISNFDLMKQLPALMHTRSAQEILAMPDFKERVDLYRAENERYRLFVAEQAEIAGQAIVLDFRGVADIPAGNRFIEYVLFAEQNISVRITDTIDAKVAMISLGRSVINRSSRVDVGAICARYGGGGHTQVGTCQVPAEALDRVLAEILEEINGPAA